MIALLNRIDRLRESHKWLSVESATQMLCARYYMATRAEDLEGPEVQAAMEEFVNEIRLMDTDDLRLRVEEAEREIALENEIEDYE